MAGENYAESLMNRGRYFNSIRNVKNWIFALFSKIILWF
ncbi:hypothetical protein N748_00195 [Legionella pneumophila str. 121004]|nr:hypothetical protein N748_00195 [Legionella pneumophila str. 121004]ERH43749.1 hypothetical protein N750_11100 [Legionella pneumophila str. Leg01/53]ERH45562.1 hypothetical protein N751_10730 [Legionella pneumophila str. Leg01/11]ERI48771.1 hypothetical protein N749_08625 [Legionella pneumophila str. Leg01/20]